MSEEEWCEELQRFYGDIASPGRRLARALAILGATKETALNIRQREVEAVRDGKLPIANFGSLAMLHSYQKDLRKENLEKVQSDEVFQRLDHSLEAFTSEVRDVLARKINDSINVKEILAGDEKHALRVTLGWVQRIMNETIADELGSEDTARFFDNGYWQICGGKLGPDDFRARAKPYKE